MVTTEPDRTNSEDSDRHDTAHGAGSADLTPAYRDHADRYDSRTSAFQHWRELLVEKLPAGQGDTVLDIGCGTGLCLPLLQQKVGPTGFIVGIDASAQMLAQAMQRVATWGWDNVRLITAPIAHAQIEAMADAAMFCAVHDLMQSREALQRVFDHLRPGAAVGAIGGKWPAPWLIPLRMWVTDLHAPFIASFAGFDRPWRLLAEFVPNLSVQELAGGAGYLAVGHTPAH